MVYGLCSTILYMNTNTIQSMMMLTFLLQILMARLAMNDSLDSRYDFSSSPQYPQ